MSKSSNAAFGEKTESNTLPFDYESRIWGNHEASLSPSSLGALRLRYSLSDLDSNRGRILEVGCGGGAMARALGRYRPDLEVFACDISRRALAFATQEESSVQFSFGDALRLPYRDGSFDAILMFDVLEHLAQPGTAINEALRVLDSDGVLHFSVPCEGNFLTIQGFLRSLGWSGFESCAGHVQAFDTNQLHNMLRSAGLMPRSVRWSGHLIGQFAHAAYIAFMRYGGKNPASSIEGFAESPSSGVAGRAVRLIKNALGWITYGESRLLSRLPAAQVHITAKNRG